MDLFFEISGLSAHVQDDLSQLTATERKIVDYPFFYQSDHAVYAKQKSVSFQKSIARYRDRLVFFQYIFRNSLFEVCIFEMYEDNAEISFVLINIFKRFFQQNHELTSIAQLSRIVFGIGNKIEQFVFDLPYESVYVLVVHIEGGAVYIRNLTDIRYRQPFVRIDFQ